MKNSATLLTNIPKAGKYVRLGIGMMITIAGVGTLKEVIIAEGQNERYE